MGNRKKGAEERERKKREGRELGVGIQRMRELFRNWN
jgi:hypothetical protein